MKLIRHKKNPDRENAAKYPIRANFRSTVDFLLTFYNCDAFVIKLRSQSSLFYKMNILESDYP